jgi:hypothetical protein
MKLCGLPAEVAIIIRQWPVREAHISNFRRRHRASPHQRISNISNKPAIAMSTPCRFAAGAARAFESSATPRIARRTFASCGSKSTTPSRTAAGARTQCLRETQRSATALERIARGVQAQTRSFSQTTPRHKLKTIDQIRARNKGGVCFNISSIALLVLE